MTTPTFFDTFPVKSHTQANRLSIYFSFGSSHTADRCRSRTTTITGPLYQESILFNPVRRKDHQRDTYWGNDEGGGHRKPHTTHTLQLPIILGLTHGYVVQYEVSRTYIVPAVPSILCKPAVGPLL